MSRARAEVAARFLKDVADHQMTVILDSGTHRHLRFKRPDCNIYWFDLVTWPGRLTISGDMGDFVFSRLLDMFQFFRTDRGADGALRINCGYWAEKVTAQCRHGRGVEQFSADLFRAAVIQHFREHTRHRGIVPGLKQEVRRQVLDRAYDGEYAAYQAVNDFEHSGFRFQDFFEHRLQEYTLGFVWCCYAIQWGIRQYDMAKAEVPA